MHTDWTSLAREIGSLRDDGSESGGNDFARIALEEILGDEWIVNTVEHILSFDGGGEVAMNCLRYIRSEKAVRYAYQVYKTSDGERASMAVWLIKHITHPIAFDWIEEFINDENVADWGIDVLDYLLRTEQVPFDNKAKSLLKIAAANFNGWLKYKVNHIKGYAYNRKNPKSYKRLRKPRLSKRETELLKKINRSHA